jgi:hypothetical protein
LVEIARLEAATRLSRRSLRFSQRGARILESLSRSSHHLAQFLCDGVVARRSVARL